MRKDQKESNRALRAENPSFISHPEFQLENVSRDEMVKMYLTGHMRQIYLVASSISDYGRTERRIMYMFRKLFKSSVLPPSVIVAGRFVQREMNEMLMSANIFARSALNKASTVDVWLWFHALSVFNEATMKKDLLVER